MVPDTLVNSLIVACKDNYIVFKGETVSHFLIEFLTIRGGVNYFIIIPFIFQQLYRPEDRLRHHYHSCPASESIIVNTFIPVFGKIVKANYIDLDKPLVPGNRGDPRARRAGGR